MILKETVGSDVKCSLDKTTNVFKINLNKNRRCVNTELKWNFPLMHPCVLPLLLSSVCLCERQCLFLCIHSLDRMEMTIFCGTLQNVLF